MTAVGSGLPASDSVPGIDDATSFDYNFNDPSFQITLNFNPIHVSYAFYFTQVLEQKEELNL